MRIQIFLFLLLSLSTGLAFGDGCVDSDKEALFKTEFTDGMRGPILFQLQSVIGGFSEKTVHVIQSQIDETAVRLGYSWTHTNPAYECHDTYFINANVKIAIPLSEESKGRSQCLAEFEVSQKVTRSHSYTQEPVSGPDVRWVHFDCEL